MAAKTKTRSNKSNRDTVTLSKIEKLARDVLGQVDQGQQPRRSRSERARSSNVSFNEKKKIIELGDRAQSREFFNTAMARKFMQTILVASGCKTLIDEGKTISIRQMFYMTKHTLEGSSENTFEDQSESDPIIEDLEVGIDALREELHLFANRRGQRRSASSSVERRGRSHRSGADGARRLGHPEHLRAGRAQVRQECEAEFILFVEKDAVLHRLNEDRFWKKHNCILMTSRGPGRARRAAAPAAHGDRAEAPRLRARR